MPAQPVSIAETVVYGVAFDPKNGERVARMDLNELFASVGRLFDLLDEREIEYVLVGGIAMLSYIEGRNTQDIDLIVAEADLPRLPELRIDERDERFARSWLGDLRVDLLFAEHDPFKTVQASCVAQRTFTDRPVPCATEEGLLLMKLFAIPSLYRQAQFKKVRIYEGDIADLLELPSEITTRVWRTLESIMLDTDVAELRKIVADIERKIAGDATRFGPADGEPG
ncbi:MAG: hypothetical protein AAF805_05035 [Planctomycetota bacterium]